MTGQPMPTRPEHDLPPDLAQPARRALVAAGLAGLERLATVSEAQVARLHGVGPTALRQLRRALAASGRSFAEPEQATARPATEPRLVAREEQPYVAIPISVPMREWGRASALVGEIIGWLGRRDVPLAGPPFFRYWVIGDMERPFDLEVGAQVAEPVPGDGRVISGAVPAGRYATLVHHGHPDRLHHSLSALEIWASAQGLEWNNQFRGGREVWGARFEFHLTDPAEQPDREQWAIQLAYQVKDPAGAA